MATAYLKELAESGKYGSLAEIEKKWDEAKKIANKEGKQSYAYVTAVLQRMLGIKAEASASPLKIEASSRLQASSKKP